MKFVIDIPEREFKADIDDHFQYFFMRLQEEIQHRLYTHDTFLCEKDELETIEMLLKSFKEGVTCGNDLKRAVGHPELQKERELPKAPADTQQAESEGEK